MKFYSTVGVFLTGFVFATVMWLIPVWPPFHANVWGTVGDWFTVLATIALAIIGWILPERIRKARNHQSKKAVANAILYEIDRYQALVFRACEAMAGVDTKYVAPLPDPISLPQVSDLLFELFEVDSAEVISCYRALDYFSQSVFEVNEYYNRIDKSALCIPLAKKRADDFRFRAIRVKHVLANYADYQPQLI